jgi:hypothetical protein
MSGERRGWKRKRRERGERGKKTKEGETVSIGRAYI